MNPDTEIFNRLYVRYRSNFIAIARSYVEDTAVAEDIVTDSFVSWWLRRNTLPENTDPRRYVVGTIKKQCLEHLRSRQIQTRAHKNLRDTNARMLAYHLASLENNTTENLHAEEVVEILRRQLYEGENETYIEASVENSGSILYDKEIRNKPRTRRTKRNV